MQFGIIHNEELSPRKAGKLGLDLSWGTQETDTEF
jgi:hypothetical protein